MEYGIWFITLINPAVFPTVLHIQLKHVLRCFLCSYFYCKQLSVRVEQEYPAAKNSHAWDHQRIWGRDLLCIHVRVCSSSTYVRGTLLLMWRFFLGLTVFANRECCLIFFAMLQRCWQKQGLDLTAALRYPTDPFTTLEPQNPLIDGSQLKKVCRWTDFEANINVKGSAG